MLRLFRLGLWLGVLGAIGFVASRYFRTRQGLERPAGEGWASVPAAPLQPVSLKAEPPAPASPVEAPVVTSEDPEPATTAKKEPAKKAPAKKAVAKKAAPATKSAPKKAPPKKA